MRHCRSCMLPVWPVLCFLPPVCLLCPGGRVQGHDQREEKKQISHRQRRGSVRWGQFHVVCLCMWGGGSVNWKCVMRSGWREDNFSLSASSSVTLFNCSVGRQDCSRCRIAAPKYGCVWCGGGGSSGGSRCVYQDSCDDEVQHTCPAPVIHFVRTFL